MTLPQTEAWELVADAQAFRALQPEWQRLFACNSAHRPFQSWPWVSTWLEQLAGDHSLHVICLRNAEGELQLLLPLVRSTGGGRTEAIRLHSFCGYGPECSDHVGVLRVPSLNTRLADLAAAGISETCDSSDRIELGNIDGTGNFPQELATRLREAKRKVMLQQISACPTLAMPASWDEYLQQLSSNFRSQVRRHSKRIDKHETLNFRSINPDEADLFVEALIRLNRSRIDAKGEVSSLEDAAFRQFLTAAVPGMAHAGLAWMDVLEDDGEIVGAALNLVHGKSVYFYMGGFAERAKNLRPGTALFARVIKRAIEAGHTHYDFLRGAESYKYRWGAHDEHTYQIAAYPRGLIGGHLAYNVDRLQYAAIAAARQALGRGQGAAGR